MSECFDSRKSPFDLWKVNSAPAHQVAERLRDDLRQPSTCDAATRYANSLEANAMIQAIGFSTPRFDEVNEEYKKLP